VFTQNYVQPSFYHFSQTTIEASQWIAYFLKKSNPMSYRIHDLFAGSGVFSLEIMHRLSKHYVGECHFWELQREFQDILKINTKTFCDSNFYFVTHIHSGDVADFFMKKKEGLDIIVMNPPHYFYGEGKKSKLDQKNMCQFIEEKKWINILQELQKTQAKIFLQLRWKTQLTAITIKSLKDKIRLIQPLSGEELLIYL
jgi:tRNA1Val (adenine37-N6)-methyltransferase